MQGKIGLEEHFAFPPTLADSEEYFEPDVWPQMRGRLIDLHDRRLAEMDELGMEMMILSLNAPTIQAIPDRRLAIDVARRANDFLAEQVVKRRDRFAAFAALPMQDPDEAARELTRCVKDLGFKGALVNGFSQVGEVDSAQYYDLPGYWPFWETVARLDVPFYLHPTRPAGQPATDLRGASVAPRVGLGVRSGNRDARLAADGSAGCSTPTRT